MVIARTYDNWQTVAGEPQWNRCSPNLAALLAEVEQLYGVTSLGCYANRPIRGSTTVISSHAYGAAVDISYRSVTPPNVVDWLIGYLVGHSDELHVQRIHDYRRSRIWTAGRTADIADACAGWWAAQRRSPITGMGQSWADYLHVETTIAGWGDTSPVGSRFP